MCISPLLHSPIRTHLSRYPPLSAAITYDVGVEVAVRSDYSGTVVREYIGVPVAPSIL